MLSNLDRAKKEIKAAGFKYFCDKQKDGTRSLKVVSQFGTAVETREIPERLYYLLLGASDSYKEFPFRVTPSYGRASEIVKGNTITRFYFK